MIRDALENAYQQLAAIETNRLDAQLLLCHVLEVERPYLIAHDDRILSDDEKSQFEALIARRATGEPIAYILGTKHFWDLEFEVSRTVLIPRPETEHLIEAALEWAKGKDAFQAADIGTGSGAIAITVAKHSHATMHAIDFSHEALAVAEKNAAKNEVTIQFYEGSLAQPLIDNAIKVDLLMANLPYIPTSDLSELEVSKHEPILALDGGEDGLDFIRELLSQVPDCCNEGALILLEIDRRQGQAVKNFAEEHLSPQDVSIIKDLAGLDRVVRIQL